MWRLLAVIAACVLFVQTAVADTVDGNVSQLQSSSSSYKVRLAAASMGQPGTNVKDLCKELGITRQTLYRHVSPTGELRDDGHKILAGRTHYRGSA